MPGPAPTLQVPADSGRTPRVSLEGNTLPLDLPGASSSFAQDRPTAGLYQRRPFLEGSAAGPSNSFGQTPAAGGQASATSQTSATGHRRNPSATSDNPLRSSRSHVAEFQSGVPVDNPAGPRHYGTIAEGQHLPLANTSQYSHVQSNNGEVTSSNNQATFKTDGNNNRLNLVNNQGEALTDTNYGTMHNQGNAGNTELGTNGGRFTSSGGLPGSHETVSSNAGKMTLDGSQTNHFVGRTTHDISVGSPARPAAPGTPAVPSRAGLVGNGTLHVGTHDNGTVTQYFDPGTTMHRFYPNGKTHRAQGKPLTLTSSGAPGFFSPNATHKAGKKWETYGPGAYHVAGAAGIYAANVAGTPSSIAGMVRTFGSLGHPASAGSSAATTATSTTGVTGVPSSVHGAAADVNWAHPPGSVPTVQTHAPANGLTFDSAGVPQVNPHPTSSSAARPHVDITVPGTAPAVHQPQPTSGIDGDTTLKTVTRPKGP